jgi:hypothetical protein
MNKRIRQLAEQAKCYADENSAHYLQNPHWIETFEEKFAELIVAKMLQTCEDHPAWTGRMIGEQIKQDFGVEE